MGSFAVVGSLAAALIGFAPLSPASATTQTFSYLGAPQIYVVPAGVTSITATLQGAAGGTGTAAGGLGATVTVDLSVNPGEVLQLNVGGQGKSFNGAGGGVLGGGATDIRRPAFNPPSQNACAYELSCAANLRVVVAGAGGGGGSSGVAGASGAIGGNGGQTPTAGIAINLGSISGFPAGNATGGGAATGSSGGAAGTGTNATSSGAAGAGGSAVGGVGGWVANATGGGGGGGYFGGGGGGTSENDNAPKGVAGGGGGVSWAGGTGASNASFTDGNVAGDGSIVIDPPSAITNATIAYTGAPQFYTTPAGVTEVAVRLYAGASGAAGDVVYGRLPVTASQTLQFNIGGQGTSYSPFAPTAPLTGGWNGGGDGTLGDYGKQGSGGGGASDIRTCANPSLGSPCALTDRVVVSGGGGGSSEIGWGLGGGTGGAAVNGDGGNGTTSPNGGGGGTSIAGGAGGGLGTSGVLGVGGSAGSAHWAGSGAGGGGFYGGGGGNDAGGGGGSSFASVTGSSGANVLGVSGAAFAHSRGGSLGTGMAVVTAMPIGVTTGSSSVTTSSVSIAGSVNPQFLASVPTVFYSATQSTVTNGGGSTAALTSSSGASTLAGNSTSTVSGSITGLSAGTTYYYRVCAKSVAGNGCGTTESFTTLPNGTVLPVVTTPTGTATSSTIIATATVTPGSSSTPVLFECATDAAFTNVVSTVTGSPSPITGSAQSISGMCTGLSVSTTYYVRVVASMVISSTTYTYPSSALTLATTAYVPPSNGGGGSSTSTTSPTIAPSAPALPPIVPLVLPQAPATGGSTLLVNGVLQTVRVQPIVSNTALEVSGPGFTMVLEGAGSNGQPLGLTPDGALILESDRYAKTTGTGFMAQTPVKLFLFSNSVYLGDVLTNSSGAFNGAVQIPLGIPAGRHTLQANGYTTDGQIRSLSLGVVVQEAVAPTQPLRSKKLVVSFAPFSSVLSTQAKTQIRLALPKSAKTVVAGTAIGYVQSSKSNGNDLALSTARAKSVSAYLAKLGVAGVVTYKGTTQPAGASAAARKVTVTLRHR